MGVPQGSILGLLIFICYVSDLSKFCDTSVSFMYADDTAHLSKGPNIDIIRHTLKSNFDKILNWFATNRLCINMSKTKTMLFSSNRSNLKSEPLIIEDGEECIEQADTFKYLSISLDRHLNFEHHIDKIVKKVNQ